MVAAGGVNSSGDKTDDIEIYTPSTNTWAVLPSVGGASAGKMPNERAYFSATVFNSKLFVAGGINNSNNFVIDIDAYWYDFAYGTGWAWNGNFPEPPPWIPPPPFPPPVIIFSGSMPNNEGRRDFGMVTSDYGGIYILGGKDANGTVLKTVYKGVINIAQFRNGVGLNLAICLLLYILLVVSVLVIHIFLLWEEKIVAIQL